jgi:hypothetical protein
VREHCAECALPDAAFAAEDEDLVLYGGEARGDDGYVRVRTFWGGGAYCLVGAAGAVVCFACLEGLGAGTVFCAALVCDPIKATASDCGWAGVPGSGATSFGAFLSGASKSTCVGSSREGAMLSCWRGCVWLTCLCVGEMSLRLDNQCPAIVGLTLWPRPHKPAEIGTYKLPHWRRADDIR